MAGPGTLQAEAETMQIVQATLLRHLATQAFRHPGRHFAAGPKTAIARRFFQNLLQRGKAVGVQ